MNETSIRWTELTWNPWSGCKKISAGCRHCYAETIAERFRGGPAFPDGFDLTIRNLDKFTEPFKVKKPSLIFMNSMSDFFLEEVSDEYRDIAMMVIRQTPQHQYQCLTKRVGKMVRYFETRAVPKNMWIGVSIENDSVEYRLKALKLIHADVRWISAEPLLGRLELDLSGIDWLVSGGESGRHLLDPETREKRALVDLVDRKWVPRQDRVEWIRSLRDQCAKYGTAFMHKQWGGLLPTSAGHLLDGIDHSDYPRSIPNMEPK
jgi:protein gp37